MSPNIVVDWHAIASERDVLWTFRGVLYVFCQARTHRVLYLGKADYSSVRERFRCRAKDLLWNYLAREHGVERVEVRVGVVIAECRLTTQLLSDTESLLIERLAPCGNVQCVTSRIQRP